MPLSNKEALHLIESLPEDCTIDDIMYELYVKNKIKAGLEAVKNGKVITHNDAIKRFS